MLSIQHMANILRKAGYDVPACPIAHDAAVPYPASLPADTVHQTPQAWGKAIETLYVSYAAARAAKSLRDAEEARMLAMLQLRPAKAYA
ncbi:hypothetical protein [Variovorax sp. E3]|jgi:hypothetical protein|uniref:hypothetical protein n=1 Tax=Variovorax sp. E3 TaxID=1914993 RepID=UPI0018DDD8D9|nr:hypothetical protein [Variovorax sp. E3]